MYLHCLVWDFKNLTLFAWRRFRQFNKVLWYNELNYSLSKWCMTGSRLPGNISMYYWNSFVFRNARFTVDAENQIQTKGINWTHQPEFFPDLNEIEHVCDMKEPGRGSPPISGAFLLNLITWKLGNWYGIWEPAYIYHVTAKSVVDVSRPVPFIGCVCDAFRLQTIDY